MSEYAMRAALERAGLTPRHQAPDARYGERSAVAFVDMAHLSDKGVIEEVALLRTESAHISRQLDDDKDDGMLKGDSWRGAAKRARRAKMLRLDQLTEEAKKRGLIAALPPEIGIKLVRSTANTALSEARDAIKLARAEAHRDAVKIASDAKVAYVKEADAINKSKCEMFVKAAYQLHSRDTCDRIWKRAREMFAGSPVWEGPTNKNSGNSAWDDLTHKNTEPTP